jgi:two-component system sensor histidine kinase CpxA
MNSLFARILIWLILTAVITATGAMIVAAIAAPDPVRSTPWPGRAVQFYADEASLAYAQGGVKELSDFLWRLDTATGIEAHLVNEQGIDLVTKVDREAALARLKHSRFPVVWHERRMIAGKPASNGNFFILYPPSRIAAFPMLVPQHLWILISVAGLSYLLARHLTNPLRKMESAAERLGKGDFSARVPLDRRDELGRLAETFNRMAGRIESLVESQQRLLRDVSHELRSPLARLGVAVELARTSAQPERELDIIQQQADRLNTLVGTLLQVSRVEADPGALRKQPLDLRELLEDIGRDCELEASAHGCRIAITAPHTLPIRGDAELLRRAVENVVRNAIRYSPRDASIDLAMKSADGNAVIEVLDAGPGVPPGTLPHLFDAFFRVDGQAGSGMGLGLWIAKRAVESHHGSISAANATPGLRVVITIPAG